MALREQGISSIDLLLLKTQVEERGLATPQVSEYLEKISRFRPPQLDQMMSYLELLKDRSSRERLLGLASKIQGYASQKEAAATLSWILQPMLCRNCWKSRSKEFASG